MMTFFRYCTVGVTNTILDFTTYTVLTRGWSFWHTHYLWANALSFTISVTWGFFWHKHWSFRERFGGHIVQYVKFWMVTAIGLAVAQMTLFTSVHVFGLPDLFGKVLAGPLVVAWNFTAHRFWTFRVRASIDDYGSQPVSSVQNEAGLIL